MPKVRSCDRDRLGAPVHRAGALGAFYDWRRPGSGSRSAAIGWARDTTEAAEGEMPVLW